MRVAPERMNDAVAVVDGIGRGFVVAVVAAAVTVASSEPSWRSFEAFVHADTHTFVESRTWRRAWWQTSMSSGDECELGNAADDVVALNITSEEYLCV